MSSRSSIGRGIALALFMVLAHDTAHATVLCKRKSGAVFTRDTCKQNETALDLQVAPATLGASEGNDLTVFGGPAQAGSLDHTGGDLALSAGPGTGLGGSGDVRIMTAGPNTASGSADDTPIDRRIIVAKPKTMTFASPGYTNLMSVKLNGTDTAGGRIHYTIRATDGAKQVVTESGVIQYVATAQSITCTVRPDDKVYIGSVNSGCTPTFFAPGSQPGVAIYDIVQFKNPAPIAVHEVYFSIENESRSAIRLE
ncbi:hypothetical protein K2Z84_24825 [Candidatus Binatia bacterium]|nr:hypothetical protein [Candidatus Binatia bacterium]